MAEPIVRGVTELLVARGQAPLAGYLRAFGTQYSPYLDWLVLVAVLAGIFAALRWFPRGDGPDRGLVPGAALFVGLVLALRFGVLGAAPHCPDEATYLFEARLILSGAAAAPAPPEGLAEAIGVPFTVVHEGRWLAAFPPGWPLVLAVGVALGAPWLANLFVGLGWFQLAGPWWRRHFGADAVGPAALLAGASPFLVVLHATTMADPLAAAACLGAVVAWEAGRPALAGAATGVAVLARPASLFFLTGAMLWALAFDPGRRRQLPAYLLGGLPAALVLAGWNFASTGSPWVSAYQLAAPGAGFLSGQATYGAFTLRHDLVAAAVNAGMNLIAMATDLLGWPALSLLPALIGVTSGGAMTRGGMARGGLVGMLVGYGLYFHPGLAFGPRFYLPAVPWLLGASALGLGRLGHAFGRAPGRAAAVALLGAAPAAVLGYWVPMTAQLARSGDIDDRPAAFAARVLPPTGALLVLVPAVGYPERPLILSFLGLADPHLRARLLFAQAPERAEVARAWGVALNRRVVGLPSDGAPWQAAP